MKLSYSQFRAPSTCSFDLSAKVLLLSPIYLLILFDVLSPTSTASQSTQTASYTMLLTLHLDIFPSSVFSHVGHSGQWHLGGVNTLGNSLAS